ncbi:MAG TPA: hypothetical protein VH475_21545 [Tepidisphaeraceae bacterium]|jgi:hypothetical protein
MTRSLAPLWLSLLCLAVILPVQAQDRGVAVTTRKPILGDFAAEIRRPNGHIDIDANIQALKALNANTYFYLIWHAASDWDDLPAFASAAQREGIDVWVYIIPWSETPLVKKSWGYSEPYRTDYVRWAQEIARLSLDHPNIVGYVIDDFYTNSTQPDRFTPAYVRRMVNAAREINPRIRFYPLLYFQQPWADFMSRFGDLVDGVVAAYPKSRVQVGNALAYLNDEPHGATAIVAYPKSRPSRVGDKGSIWADLRVTDPQNATVSFYWDDDDHTTNRGYHMAFVKVDGRIVWQADTAGDVDDHVVEVDLARLVRGHRSVRVEMGVYERQAVSKYPVTVRFDDIRLTGFDTPTEMASERLWNRKPTGNFSVDLLPANKAQGRYHLPMILMPAGEREQHEKRYSESGSPRNIAEKVRMCFDLVRQGRVEGVVTYCLPKGADDPTFDAVKQEYRRAAADLFSDRPPARGKGR